MCPPCINWLTSYPLSLHVLEASVLLTSPGAFDEGLESIRTCGSGLLGRTLLFGMAGALSLRAPEFIWTAFDMLRFLRAPSAVLTSGSSCPKNAIPYECFASTHAETSRNRIRAFQVHWNNSLLSAHLYVGSNSVCEDPLYFLCSSNHIYVCNMVHVRYCDISKVTEMRRQTFKQSRCNFYTTRLNYNRCFSATTWCWYTLLHLQMTKCQHLQVLCTTTGNPRSAY